MKPPIVTISWQAYADAEVLMQRFEQQQAKVKMYRRSLREFLFDVEHLTEQQQLRITIESQRIILTRHQYHIKKLIQEQGNRSTINMERKYEQRLRDNLFDSIRFYHKEFGRNYKRIKKISGIVCN